METAGLFLVVLILDIFVGIAGKNKKIGFWGGFFLSLLLSPLIGIIVVLLSGKKIDTKEEHKFLYYKELAKKAEFKGQYKEAIDNLMDCQYHLENDYKNKKLDQKSEEGRQKKIIGTKAKIENLKKLLSEQQTNVESKPDEKSEI